MNIREEEYKQLGVDVRWLDTIKAQHAYNYALKYSSQRRYGLNEASVTNIQRLIIESYSVADAWLKANLPAEGTLQVVYSKDEVCVIDAIEFLEHWPELFAPSRDDAIIIHNLHPTILFYCHEEELEVGQRLDLI